MASSAADHQPGHSYRRQPEPAARHCARANPARGLRAAGEDHPFRPRAHPERIMHARGSAAHGYFELTRSLQHADAGAEGAGELRTEFAAGRYAARNAGRVPQPRHRATAPRAGCAAKGRGRGRCCRRRGVIEAAKTRRWDREEKVRTLAWWCRIPGRGLDFIQSAPWVAEVDRRLEGTHSAQWVSLSPWIP